ncbi:reverse transcriptase domain-containing protein [Tanacetum coccineum]
MNMTIQSSIKDRILAAQKETSEAVNAPAEMLRGLDEQMEHRSDGAFYYLDRIWQSMQEALGTQLDMSTTYHPQNDSQSEHPIQTLEDMLRACVLNFRGSWDVHLPLVEFSYNNSYHSSIRCASFEVLYGRKCRSSILWEEIRESQLIGLEIVQELQKRSYRSKIGLRLHVIVRKAMQTREGNLYNLVWVIDESKDPNQHLKDFLKLVDSLDLDGENKERTRTVFRDPPYLFDYPTRRLTMEEILAKFIDEGRREHEEMEIFIKEFRTTNELLLKTRSNLLSELKIEVNELSKVVSNVLIPKNEVKGVTTRGGKMTSEATRSKEINETGININEPPGFEQDVQEKPNDDGVENKSSSIPERTTQPLVKPQQSSIPFPNRVRKEKEEALQRNFLENLKQLDINISFIEALVQIPKYAKYLKKKVPTSFTIPYQVLEKHKEAEDLAANHSSRLETPHMEVLTERKIADKFSDEHLMVLKSKSNNDEPWYADFVNYIVRKEPYAFKLCADNIMKKCVAGSETLEILAHYHSRPTGGHHGANVTAKKVYESGFYWPSIFKDANEYTKKWHDSRLRGDKDFKVGDKVLLYNSRLKMYPGKLKSKWSGPNIVKIVYPHGAIEITNRDGFSFKVNGQRLKKYYGGNIDKEDDEVIEFENGVTTLEAKNIDKYWWRIYKYGDLKVLES